MNGDRGIYVGPDFEGRIPRSALLLESAGFLFGFPPSSLEMPERLILSIRDEDFATEICLRQRTACLARNGQVLSVPLDISDTGWTQGSAFLGVSWNSRKLTIAASSKDGLKVSECLTPFTLPPNSLSDWARREALIPTQEYDNKRHFQDTLLNGLRALTEKIQESGMHYAFWDGRSRSERKPKLEIHCHPTIHGLLHDFCVQKNLTLTREDIVGNGSVDFTFSGILRNRNRVTACVEFKNAHSTDLEHGLISQLPDYLRRKSTDIGFYCVLWYGVEQFRSPPQSKEHFRAHLIGILRDQGLSNIALEIVDLSPQQKPSGA